MRIVCDLLSTIMPPMPDPLEDCRRPDYPSMIRLLPPVVYASSNRKEVEDNA